MESAIATVRMESSVKKHSSEHNSKSLVLLYMYSNLEPIISPAIAPINKILKTELRIKNS